ncbi:putative DNA-binding pseudobarrel domain superfamily [Helianthus debilis subsp. tardiflorus]
MTTRFYLLFNRISIGNQPPTQELVARDLHDHVWTFCHIYCGMSNLFFFSLTQCTIYSICNKKYLANTVTELNKISIDC